MTYDISAKSKSYQKVDEAITQSLFALLENNDFEKITVSQIIKKAGINRSTFYRHYVDKYEILDHIREHTVPVGDAMIAPFIKDGKHSFDIMFNSSYLNDYVPQSYKRMFLLLLKVRTNNFNMEQLVKDSFARHYLPGDNSSNIKLERELYSDICYRLLVHSLTHPEEKVDGHKAINDLVKYINEKN